MRTLFLVIGLAVLVIGCKKTPGDGGLATIRGKVVEEIRFVLTNPATYATEYPAPDEDVWIVYGNNVSPDERVRTNYDGEFEFQFLRPGEYTIYVYSNDTTGATDVAPDRMPIIKTITIDERRQDIDLGEFRIYERP
jgi:hypothetical protein